MGTIQRRDSNKGPATYQARIRRAGHPQLSHSFPTREQAEEWIAQTEAEFVRNKVAISRDKARAKLSKTKDLINLPLGYLLERYRLEISPQKRSGFQEAIRLKHLGRHAIAAYTLAQLTPAIMALWRDSRIAAGLSGSAVNRDLALLGHVIAIARQEWGVILASNSVHIIRKAKNNPPRVRRLAPAEEVLIMQAAQNCRGGFLPAMIQLALETGMRQGELVNLDWEHIHLQERYAHLPVTKNGSPRSVPLSMAAIAVLRPLAIIELTPDRAGPVFPGVTGEAVKRAFQNACKRAGVLNFHFHDLRHEASSRLVEKGLSTIEVASITGHKTLSMLQRYVHLDASNLAKKLD